MAPFRRHVNLEMSRDIYKKLGNHPDTEKAWRLIRCSMGEEIFRRDFVAVPQIESARYYNQLFVFKKQFDPCSFLRLTPPRYRIMNNLDNLIDIELSTWVPRYDFTPWNTGDRSTWFTEFKLELESSESEEVHKSIEVTLKKLHVRSANPPLTGSTILRRESTRGYTAYIITSVVYANYVRISVCIGTEQNVYLNRHVTPVGFKYRKYRISANGYLDTELETTLKISDREAMWLRPISIPILRNPLWDPMRRWNPETRPTRNILTMSTSTPSIPTGIQIHHNRELAVINNANNLFPVNFNNNVPGNVDNIIINIFNPLPQAEIAFPALERPIDLRRWSVSNFVHV